MPQVAYIVKLDQPNGIDKLVTSDEIADELSGAGFSVLSVEPWASPNDALSAGQSLLSNPSLGLGGLSSPGLSDNLPS